jgi:hypothetical protein
MILLLIDSNFGDTCNFIAMWFINFLCIGSRIINNDKIGDKIYEMNWWRCYGKYGWSFVISLHTIDEIEVKG